MALNWCPKLAEARALVSEPLLPELADIVLEYGEPPSLEVEVIVAPEGETHAQIRREAVEYAENRVPPGVPYPEYEAEYEALYNELEQKFLQRYTHRAVLVRCPYCPDTLHLEGRSISTHQGRHWTSAPPSGKHFLQIDVDSRTLVHAELDTEPADFAKASGVLLRK